MSILVDKNTRLICQGITGKAGKFHSEQCRNYGTNLVGGVTPGRGGETLLGGPGFDTCVGAGEGPRGDAPLGFLPPPGAAGGSIAGAAAPRAPAARPPPGAPVRD